MSASLSIEQAASANPLDVMEQIVTANDWVFDRRGDSELAAEAPGKWCDYGLYFNWSHEISAMHFTCTFDLKVPEKQRTALYELARQRAPVDRAFRPGNRRWDAIVPPCRAVTRRFRRVG
jgi:hypothetical protein